MGPKTCGLQKRQTVQKNCDISDQQSGVNFTEDNIKTRWKNLPTTFQREHKKVVAGKKSGAGSDTVYTSKLRFYEKLLILCDCGEPCCSIDNLPSDVLLCSSSDNMPSLEHSSLAPSED
ncbi:hypothetical protein AOXY_G36098 [Acipenser oxyrinchus oxyrinchus]|uniref:MADF domain-containing protein n=1 Tax=Acipenser oxyrinchus oxyrinchus TaxID=40147 RepID=A0AAD8CEI1_ACIOX|nr:hypothetical protein AOXY_G36098 [Acipenser oxyrinchus oxyrinchus]